MENPTYDAMKFGSENDLKKALTELRVIKKQNGRITEKDFIAVSQKYMFPTNFLKKGLEGFSYPDDYFISKSKWYQIFYSWIVRDKEHSLRLYRLQFAYIWRTWVAIYAITFLIMVLVYVETALIFYIQIDLFQNLVGIVLPIVSLIIGLVVSFEFHLHDKKVKIEEYSQQLREEGLGYIVEGNQRLVVENYRAIAYGAGKILLKRFEEPNTLIVIPIGVNEENKEPSARIKRLSRLHLLPKSFAVPRKEKVPVFYGENPYVEYQKRIEEASVGKQHSAKSKPK